MGAPDVMAFLPMPPRTADEEDYMPLCTANENALRHGKGYCVYCLGEVTRVRAWIQDRAGKTAICPHCHIDAVIPESWIEDGGDPARRLAMLCQWRAAGVGPSPDHAMQDLLQQPWIVGARLGQSDA